MFSDNLLVLANFKYYRGNEKYVLVLVQCHDGMITNSINLVCVLHSSSTRARPNRLISFVIIASWHWTMTRTSYWRRILTFPGSWLCQNAWFIWLNTHLIFALIWCVDQYEADIFPDWIQPLYLLWLQYVKMQFLFTLIRYSFSYKTYIFPDLTYV